MLMTLAVTLQGDAFDPFSKPGLPSNCSVTPPPPPELTVRPIVVECDLPPPEPPIETLYVPAVTADPTRIVNVDEPAPGAPMFAGLKPAVAPAGKPEPERAIAESKLPEVVVVIKTLAELPGAIVKVEGDEEIAKSAAGPPDALELRLKSSTTNDVFRLPFSVPTK